MSFVLYLVELTICKMVKSTSTKRLDCPALDCDASYHVEGELDRHAASKHHGQALFKCTAARCDAFFVSIAERKNHVATLHDKICHPVSCGELFLSLY